MSVVPELSAAGRVLRPSTSSGITRADTGQAIAGSNGLHLFVQVQDGAGVERVLKALHARCWLHGLGWMMVGAGGQLLERSLVDRMVYARSASYSRPLPFWTRRWCRIRRRVDLP